MVTALVFTLPTGTAGPKDKLYPWERKHKSPATTTDAVLCYGASHHRNPFLWDKGRFAPYVTYVDPDGKEQWLFDGFIFLESQDVDRPDSGAYSFMTGVLRDTGVSAGKEQWQELIDYYFTKGNCVDALEQAVKEATARLGKAPCKRRVIMMIPDPIIHRHYIDTTTTTTYWGELGGRRLDFNSNEDRVAACRWYIDQVRARFAQGDYKYIDLAGFYWIREIAAQPHDTEYSYHLTRSDILLPEIADYLHRLNYTFSWIPFYDARGHDDWRKFGFDQVYMQPNHYWKPENDLDSACMKINRAGTSIEFEFEASIPQRRSARRHIPGTDAQIHGIRKETRHLRHPPAGLLPGEQCPLRPLGLHGRNGQGVLPRILQFRREQPGTDATLRKGKQIKKPDIP